jgi:hypothetical protein
VVRCEEERWKESRERGKVRRGKRNGIKREREGEDRR